MHTKKHYLPLRQEVKSFQNSTLAIGCITSADTCIFFYDTVWSESHSKVKSTKVSLIILYFTRPKSMGLVVISLALNSPNCPMKFLDQLCKIDWSQNKVTIQALSCNVNIYKLKLISSREMISNQAHEQAYSEINRSLSLLAGIREV